MSPILAALVLVLVFVLVYKQFKGKELKNYPPGPARLPFIGSYLHLLWIDYYHPHFSLTKLKEIYKSPVISFGMGPYNVVVANDHESCREVFIAPEMQGRALFYPNKLRTFGEKNGFFGDDGPRWLHMRRQTLRALRDFGFGRRSEPFESVIEEEARSFVEFLSETKGEPQLAPEIFFHTLFNLINHLIHGVRFPTKERNILTNLGKFAQGVITGTDNTGRLLALWPWIRHIFPETSGYNFIVETSRGMEVYIRHSYGRHQENFDEECLRDIIDYFIKMKKQYPEWTDEEVIISCMDLMFPHAAVALLISFTLAFLIEQPKLMKKCQEQIDEIVGRGRLPTLNDRESLKMVEMSLRETMRYQTIAPLGLPHEATEDCTLGGFFVPKGSTIITNLHAMNNDPKVWGDPEVFRPERFIGEGVKDTSLPFGLGKRVCAGETHARQIAFVVLASILQNFNVEVGTALDPKRYVTGVTVIPNSDFSLKFIPR